MCHLALLLAIVAQGPAPAGDAAKPAVDLAKLPAYEVMAVNSVGTVTLRVDGKAAPYDLVGIEPFGHAQATEERNDLKAALGDGAVKLVAEPPASGTTSKHPLAHLYRASDGASINLDLIDKGQARASQAYAHRDSDLFARRESAAKDAKAGFWSSDASADPNAKPSTDPASSPAARHPRMAPYSNSSLVTQPPYAPVYTTPYYPRYPSRRSNYGYGGYGGGFGGRSVMASPWSSYGSGYTAIPATTAATTAPASTPPLTHLQMIAAQQQALRQNAYNAMVASYPAQAYEQPRNSQSPGTPYIPSAIPGTGAAGPSPTIPYIPSAIPGTGAAGPSPTIPYIPANLPPSTNASPAIPQIPNSTSSTNLAGNAAAPQNPNSTNANNPAGGVSSRQNAKQQAAAAASQIQNAPPHAVAAHAQAKPKGPSGHAQSSPQHQAMVQQQHAMAAQQQKMVQQEMHQQQMMMEHYQRTMMQQQQHQMNAMQHAQQHAPAAHPQAHKR